ncbi:MAG: NAD-dependent epimerase/dehydratase family protein [Dehalococcoidales bacterium]
MNILVTGGLGVNGAWIVRQLLDEGHQPISYSRHVDTTLVPDIADKFDIVVGDVLDIASLIRVLKEHQVKRIIHMSALMPGPAQANPLMGFQTNASGTVNVLEAARIMEVERVVFASSKGVYASFTGEYGYPTYKPVDEEYPLRPISTIGVYGSTKIASEFMGIVYSHAYGIEFIALRAGGIYGIGKSARHGRIAIFGNMIENAMAGAPNKIPVGGDEKDDVIYVKDYTNAAVLACFAKNPKHHIYNIGAGQAYSLRDFANAIKKIYPEAEFDIGPGRDYMKMPEIYCVMNFSRAKEELGYTPKFSLEDGVRDYVESMRKLNIEPVYRPW